MPALQRHPPAPPRSGAAGRRPSHTGFRGSRDRRRPASAAAPLSTPRIFVSSRRRRHAAPRILIAVLLWAAAVSAVVAAVT
jgi:hypothetical protein